MKMSGCFCTRKHCRQPLVSQTLCIISYSTIGLLLPPHNKNQTYLAPTNSSHSNIRFHCKMVSKGVKSKLRALSPVHEDGKMTFCCLLLLDVDIVDLLWHTLDFIQTAVLWIYCMVWIKINMKILCANEWCFGCFFFLVVKRWLDSSQLIVVVL